MAVRDYFFQLMGKNARGEPWAAGPTGDVVTTQLEVIFNKTHRGIHSVTTGRMGTGLVPGTRLWKGRNPLRRSPSPLLSQHSARNLRARNLNSVTPLSLSPCCPHQEQEALWMPWGASKQLHFNGSCWGALPCGGARGGCPHVTSPWMGAWCHGAHQGCRS